MSQSLSSTCRRRGHTLPPQSTATPSLTPSRGELEEEDSYELHIDRSLDLARPRRLSTPAATGQWASPSLCAQSADREDDLIDRLLDAPDSPHLGEEPVVQVGSTGSSRPFRHGRDDAAGEQPSDSQLDEVTVSDAESRGTTERTRHQGALHMGMSRSAEDERQDVGSNPRLPHSSAASISEPREETGSVARQHTGSSSSRAPLHLEPFPQELEELLQNGPLPSAAQSGPRPISPNPVQPSSIPEEAIEELPANGPLPNTSPSEPSGSQISLDAIQSASLPQDDLEEYLINEPSLRASPVARSGSHKSPSPDRKVSLPQDDPEEYLINGPSLRASRDPGFATLAVPASDHHGPGSVARPAKDARRHVLPGLAGSSLGCTGQGDSPSRGEATRKRRLPPSPSSPQDRSRKRPKHAEKTARINVKPIERPDFWTGVAPLSPGLPLWAAVVTTEVDGETDASSRPLALVCTRPLALVPAVRDSIVLDISHRLNNKQSTNDARFLLPCLRSRITNAGPFDALNDEQIRLATRWTREVLALHLERVIQPDLGPQKYLLLPMVSQRSQEHAEDRTKKVEIDWDEIRMLDRGLSRPLAKGRRGPVSPNDLWDMVLFDRACPRRRLLVERQGYMPRMQISGTEARSSKSTGESWESSVWSIAVHRSEVFHPKDNGPIHEQLTTSDLHRLGTHTCVSFLSTTVFRSTSLIPAISSAIDDTSLGLEVSGTLFDGIISPEATLTAITLPAAVPGNSSKCYERLELLGDAVLHLLCAIGLRFASHAKREMQELESNANLRRLALEAGLQRYFRNKSPRKAVWGPSGRTIFETVRSRKEETISLRAKQCADVVEALIGAAFLQGHGSLRRALMVLEKLKLRLPRVEEITVIAEKAGALDPDFPGGYVDGLPPLQRGSRYPTVSGLTTVPRPLLYTLEWLDQVAAILGCDMTNCRETCRLLNRGTVDDWEDCWGGTSLGYQVLYTRTLGYLLRQLPFATPTTLSPLVQGLISTGCLAAFCVTSGLVDTILSISPEQRRLIQDYKAAVLAATSGTEGDPLETDEFWTEIQAPPFLGHYVAVLVEGMICDADFNFEPARIVFNTRIRPFFEKYCRAVTDGSVEKGRRLEVFLRENRCRGLTVSVNQEPTNSVQQCSVATVRVHDKLWAQARGPIPTIARQTATRLALQQLSTLPPSAYCTCSTQGKKSRAIDQDLQLSGSSGTGSGDPD